MAALETTKRKFHQLLDNLTSGNSNTPSSLLPGSKRRRIEPRGRLSQTPKQPILRSGAPDPPPYYAPWSHELFLARLKTFADVYLWSSKPPRVDEVAWAKRGWTCVGFNTVACKGGCEQRVVVSLRPERKDEDGNDIAETEDFSAEVDEAIVERFAELIELGHGEECLWRGKACGEDIYHMPMARKAVWLPQLTDRYRSFVRVAGSLPRIDRLEFDFDVQTVQRQLPSSVFDAADATGSGSTGDNAEIVDGEPAAKTVSGAALAFALLGWTATTEGGDTMVIATCNACFRRLGLWLYTSTVSPDTDSSTIDDTESKLDLQHSHRDHCPWINAQSQCMPGSLSHLAGWEFLQKAIHDNAEFQSSERPLTAGGRSNGASQAGQVEGQTQSDSSDALAVKTREQVDKEDNARFARLKELTQSMGLKNLRMKLSRS